MVDTLDRWLVTRHVWEENPRITQIDPPITAPQKILLKPISTSIPKTTPTTKPAQEPTNRILIEEDPLIALSNDEDELRDPRASISSRWLAVRDYEVVVDATSAG